MYSLVHRLRRTVKRYLSPSPWRMLTLAEITAARTDELRAEVGPAVLLAGVLYHDRSKPEAYPGATGRTLPIL